MPRTPFTAVRRTDLITNGFFAALAVIAVTTVSWGLLQTTHISADSAGVQLAVQVLSTLGLTA